MNDLTTCQICQLFLLILFISNIRVNTLLIYNIKYSFLHFLYLGPFHQSFKERKYVETSDMKGISKIYHSKLAMNVNTSRYLNLGISKNLN